MGKRTWIRILPLMLIISLNSGLAQKVFFTGLGRALVTHDQLRGNVLNGDTTSARRGTEGYVLFDLGINLQPYDFLRGKAIIRLKNKFGAFYGQGASVEFRQVLLEGLIAKKIRYALGDVDVQMTPYTVFNAEPVTSSVQAEIFKMRRDIVFYENFNVGNNWRVQGAKANASLLFRNSVSKILINGFVSRTRPTNYVNLPDRFLAGATIAPLLGNHTRLGMHLVKFFDLSSGTMAAYRNKVYSLSGSTKIEGKALRPGFQAEGGYSFTSNDSAGQTRSSVHDFFFTGHAELLWRKPKINFSTRYMETGAFFYSPSAQTLRIDPRKTPSLFPALLNNTASRSQLGFDRVTQESLYNQTIYPQLLPFLPQYGNAMPYGQATPNRKGLVFKIDAGDDQSVLQLTTGLSLLQEIIGEGTTSKRDFQVWSAGGLLKVNKILKSSRTMELSANFNSEQTSRNGPAMISLENQNLEAGLTLETIRSIDLLAGYKMVSSSGNEFISARDSYNNIIAFTPVAFDFTQGWLAAGMRWRLETVGVFTIHANYTAVRQTEVNRSYHLVQYFVNYTVKF